MGGYSSSSRSSCTCTTHSTTCILQWDRTRDNYTKQSFLFGELYVHTKLVSVIITRLVASHAYHTQVVVAYITMVFTLILFTYLAQHYILLDKVQWPSGSLNYWLHSIHEISTIYLTCLNALSRASLGKYTKSHKILFCWTLSLSSKSIIGCPIFLFVKINQAIPLRYVH